jgi:hypothetical protein
MSAFYAVGVFSQSRGTLEVLSVFEYDEHAAYAKAEVDLADDERIEWVRVADDDVASQIADAFNGGYALGRADGCLEDGSVSIDEFYPQPMPEHLLPDTCPRCQGRTYVNPIPFGEAKTIEEAAGVCPECGGTGKVAEENTA